MAKKPFNILYMKYFIAFLLITVSLSLFTIEHYKLKKWLIPPAQRLTTEWQKSIQKESKANPSVKTALMLLKKWNITLTEPYFTDLLNATIPPFKKSKKGRYTLVIQVMPWIEDMEYGFIFQHELFDSQGNKTHEFNHNLPVGQLW